jgi:hypothetical protein
VSLVTLITFLFAFLLLLGFFYVKKEKKNPLIGGCSLFNGCGDSFKIWKKKKKEKINKFTSYILLFWNIWSNWHRSAKFHKLSVFMVHDCAPDVYRRVRHCKLICVIAPSGYCRNGIVHTFPTMVEHRSFQSILTFTWLLLLKVFLRRTRVHLYNF